MKTSDNLLYYFFMNFMKAFYFLILKKALMKLLFFLCKLVLFWKIYLIIIRFFKYKFWLNFFYENGAIKQTEFYYR